MKFLRGYVLGVILTSLVIWLGLRCQVVSPPPSLLPPVYRLYTYSQRPINLTITQSVSSKVSENFSIVESITVPYIGSTTTTSIADGYVTMSPVPVPCEMPEYLKHFIGDVKLAPNGGIKSDYIGQVDCHPDGTVIWEISTAYVRQFQEENK